MKFQRIYSTTLDPFLCEIAGDNVPALAELFVSVFKGFEIVRQNHVNLASSRHHPCQRQ